MEKYFIINQGDGLNGEEKPLTIAQLLQNDPSIPKWIIDRMGELELGEEAEFKGDYDCNVKRVDLFAYPPEELQTVLNSFSALDETYENCAELLKQCEALGYTFDYYLDAVPYNLRPLKYLIHGFEGYGDFTCIAIITGADETRLQGTFTKSKNIAFEFIKNSKDRKL